MNKTIVLRIKKIIHETAEAITVVFDTPEDISYLPGQFLTIILSINGETLHRSYSISSSPYSTEDIAITVKRVAGGKVSNYINEHLKEGDTLFALAPSGKFTVDCNENTKKTYYFFAGGSGITPILSMIKSILIKEPQSHILLYYSNRDEDSIIFKKTLEELSVKYTSRLSVKHILTKVPENWSAIPGRINNKMVRGFLPDHGTDQQESSFYMCGPEGMMQEIRTAFNESGWDPDLLKKEIFTKSNDENKDTQPVLNNGAQNEKRVIIHYLGDTYTFLAKPGQTILEAALQNDIDLPFSCQSGLCTTCMGKCTSGKVDLSEDDALSENEINQGYVLTCVGYAQSDPTIIEIE